MWIGLENATRCSRGVGKAMTHAAYPFLGHKLAGGFLSFSCTPRPQTIKKLARTYCIVVNYHGWVSVVVVPLTAAVILLRFCFLVGHFSDHRRWGEGG